MLVLVLFLFSSLFSLDINRDDLDLKAPIAKERSDGYNLPASSFSENSSLESWFIKEKGFESESKNTAKKKQKIKRGPSSKRSLKRQSKSQAEVESRKKRYQEYLRKKRQQQQRRKSK